MTVTGAAPLIETSNASTGEVLDQSDARILARAEPEHLHDRGVGADRHPLRRSVPEPDGRPEQRLVGLVRRRDAPRQQLHARRRLALRPAEPRRGVSHDGRGRRHEGADSHLRRGDGADRRGRVQHDGKIRNQRLSRQRVFQDRPNSLATASYFDKLAGKPKPSGPFYYYHGESFGGPIKKNKIFFWSSHEGYVEELSGTATGVVATELEKAGNFSQTFDRNGNLIVIYDPLTTRQLPNGTYTRDPFPGNIIPANRMSTVARNMVKDRPRSGHAGQRRQRPVELSIHLADSHLRRSVHEQG